MYGHLLLLWVPTNLDRRSKMPRIHPNKLNDIFPMFERITHKVVADPHCRNKSRGKHPITDARELKEFMRKMQDLIREDYDA